MLGTKSRGPFTKRGEVWNAVQEKMCLARKTVLSAAFHHPIQCQDEAIRTG
jgi:hypothetical protein